MLCFYFYYFILTVFFFLFYGLIIFCCLSAIFLNLSITSFLLYSIKFSTLSLFAPFPRKFCCFYSVPASLYRFLFTFFFSLFLLLSQKIASAPIFVYLDLREQPPPFFFSLLLHVLVCGKMVSMVILVKFCTQIECQWCCYCLAHSYPKCDRNLSLSAVWTASLFLFVCFFLLPVVFSFHCLLSCLSSDSLPLSVAIEIYAFVGSAFLAETTPCFFTYTYITLLLMIYAYHIIYLPIYIYIYLFHQHFSFFLEFFLVFSLSPLLCLLYWLVFSLSSLFQCCCKLNVERHWSLM